MLRSSCNNTRIIKIRGTKLRWRLQTAQGQRHRYWSNRVLWPQSPYQRSSPLKPHDPVCHDANTSTSGFSVINPSILQRNQPRPRIIRIIPPLLTERILVAHPNIVRAFRLTPIFSSNRKSRATNPPPKRCPGYVSPTPAPNQYPRPDGSQRLVLTLGRGSCLS